MQWFSRPPYLRWLAAAAIVLIGLVLELADRATIQYPFAARELSRGDFVDADAVEWRAVPTGLLAQADLSMRLAARDIAAGEPLVPTALTADPPLGDGWWSVPLALPSGAVPGSSVKIVLTDPVAAVDGIVVAPGATGTFGVDEPGLVAVPEADSVTVAAAVAAREVVVLLAP